MDSEISRRDENSNFHPKRINLLRKCKECGWKSIARIREKVEFKRRWPVTFSHCYITVTVKILPDCKLKRNVVINAFYIRILLSYLSFDGEEKRKSEICIRESEAKFSLAASISTSRNVFLNGQYGV